MWRDEWSQEEPASPFVSRLNPNVELRREPTEGFEVEFGLYLDGARVKTTQPLKNSIDAFGAGAELVLGLMPTLEKVSFEELMELAHRMDQQEIALDVERRLADPLEGSIEGR